MLLNYNKPVQASSTLGEYSPNNAVDESIKTYWSAATADPGEWIQTDLGKVSTVNAIQINYAGRQVELRIEDNQSTNPTTVLAYTKLIEAGVVDDTSEA